ncbi:leukocyte-associated immunoglobulin-like receptor 2 isoform X2 [Macaca fascicularis]|uniref:leukocyte-associated immunoglobulin-like receptor 2 isoform X2 n=1 Tax=Macaca fascicularis TaxID=9541 RepID=UPI0032B0482D
MNLPPTTFLGFRPLPRPSISAEPGTVIPPGRPVTIVCRGPVGVDQFRLVREDRSKFNDTKDVSQASPSESEARFRIDSVSEGNAGRYRCLYRKSAEWSQYSDYLDLVVKGAPDEVSPSPTEADSSSAPITQNCKVKNIVCMSLAGVVLLILAVILAEAWHSQRGANNDLGNADKRAPLRQVRPQDLKGTFQML